MTKNKTSNSAKNKRGSQSPMIYSYNIRNKITVEAAKTLVPGKESFMMQIGLFKKKI